MKKKPKQIDTIVDRTMVKQPMTGFQTYKAEREQHHSEAAEYHESRADEAEAAGQEERARYHRERAQFHHGRTKEMNDKQEEKSKAQKKIKVPPGIGGTGLAGSTPAGGTKA